jgi:hypothetical protein
MQMGGRVMHAVSVVVMEAGSGNGDDNIREWVFYVRVVDPIATDVVAADEPWAAYHPANKASDVLVDDLTWLPHGGEVRLAAWTVSITGGEASPG